MSEATNIRYQWSAGEICFDCPCGATEIILSEGGDTKTCGCGRIYTLHHYVTVQESTDA